MKFKDFQAPILFSSTFKALNLGEKIRYFQGSMGTLKLAYCNITGANFSIWKLLGPNSQLVVYT